MGNLMTGHRQGSISATVLITTMLTFAAASVTAQPARPADTEVHTPVPALVTPGARDGDPPSDAVILFSGRDLSQWVSTRDKSAAGWTVADGVLTVKKAAGNIETRQTFASYQLHLEWKVPVGITGEGQGRGNSGLFLASPGAGDAGYELQILDSYENATYVNGQAASIYKQSIPLVNASRKPGEWQSYDVIWTAPTFNADGTLRDAARVSVLHNGVLVQNNFILPGETRYIGKATYRAHGPSPIKLQAHGDPSAPLSFRNIWVRPLGGSLVIP